MENNQGAVTETTLAKIKTLPESVFNDESSAKVESFYRKPATFSESNIDMGRDSYIVGCCGHRGAGKNLWMSYFGLKAAWLYHKRLLTNYPLAVRIKTDKGRYVTIQSEPLDIAKMLEFDKDYDNCIICIQEAPTIINRMAAPTWKNRLLNLWIQEIRHSHSSLIYESQNEYWVDGELQWQTDVLCYARDASRRYPQSGLSRGGIILGTFKDKSGQWTGWPFDERPEWYRKYLEAKSLWGVYDTYYKGDIWESLKRVDMKLSKHTVDHRDTSGGPTYEDKKSMAGQIITSLLTGTEKTTGSKDFYSLIPEIGNDKNKLANELFAAGTKRTRAKDGNYTLDFTDFDNSKFTS